MEHVIMSVEMNWIRKSFALIVLCLTFLLQGCGSSDQPELGEVTGTITFDKQPLVGVAVVFQPENGRPARGMTNAEGKYELIYIRQTKGSKVGPNRVEIAPSEAGEAEEAASGGEEPEAGAKKSKSGKPTIPARYNVRSELTADVKPGKNTFNFDLESK